MRVHYERYYTSTLKSTISKCIMPFMVSSSFMHVQVESINHNLNELGSAEGALNLKTCMCHQLLTKNASSINTPISSKKAHYAWLP